MVKLNLYRKIIILNPIIASMNIYIFMRLITLGQEKIFFVRFVLTSSKFEINSQQKA